MCHKCLIQARAEQEEEKKKNAEGLFIERHLEWRRKQDEEVKKNFLKELSSELDVVQRTHDVPSDIALLMHIGNMSQEEAASVLDDKRSAFAACLVHL